jgi:hypothetical protein
MYTNLVLECYSVRTLVLLSTGLVSLSGARYALPSRRTKVDNA